MTAAAASTAPVFVQTKLLEELRALPSNIRGLADLIREVEAGAYLPGASACSNAMLALRLDQLGQREMAARAGQNYYNACEAVFQADLASATLEALALLREKPARLVVRPPPPTPRAADDTFDEFDWMSEGGLRLMERMVGSTVREDDDDALTLSATDAALASAAEAKAKVLGASTGK